MNPVFRVRHWDELVSMCRQQQKTIRDLRRANLELHREMLDLTVAWRLSMEQPEVDIRDDVQGAIQSISDKIAVMEEHLA